MTESVDMSEFIEARSDQLNADDLLDGPRTITITRVSGTGNGEQPIAVHYEGENGRPFMPCKTVRRIMVGVWGKDASHYTGRSMTLYRDPAVAFGGMQVGGIRVSHMSHIDSEKTLALMVTRGRKAPFKILPLKLKAEPAQDVSVALKALEDAAAEGTEALGNVWRQKWMAPHREALQVDLDRLKAVAAKNDAPATAKDATDPPAPDERPAEDSPEVNDVAQAAAVRIIAEIRAMQSSAAIMDVNKLLARYELDLAAMPETMAREIEAVAQEARDAIRERNEREKAKEAAE